MHNFADWTCTVQDHPVRSVPLPSTPPIEQASPSHSRVQPSIAYTRRYRTALTAPTVTRRHSPNPSPNPSVLRCFGAHNTNEWHTRVPPLYDMSLSYNHCNALMPITANSCPAFNLFLSRYSTTAPKQRQSRMPLTPEDSTAIILLHHSISHAAAEAI